MNSIARNEFLSTLRIGVISGIVSAIFMYFFYYRGWQSIGAGLCIGFFIPLCLSFYTNRIIRKYLIKLNLLILLTINTLVHLIVIFVIAVFFVVIFYMKGDFSQIYTNTNFLFSHFLLIGIGFGVTLSLIFNFFSILNTLIGRQILGKLFIGMYRKPAEVDRVFMFLDIKSSTTIAEQIGHIRFLSLVNDFFYDIVQPVLQTKGEIYKYVGDEAIITWKTKDAIKNANCVHCFFLIDETIKKKAAMYMKKYGIVPEFKAGIHGGISVTGELGYTKREIAYMGDVLNTTARIEEACKKYKEDLLVSEHIVSQIGRHENYQFTAAGKEKLRGKKTEIALFKIKS
ncbi:MAG: adenylate/guanylate cyclase domain-containing protein [Bacteroidales bacterium]